MDRCSNFCTTCMLLCLLLCLAGAVEIVEVNERAYNCSLLVNCAVLSYPSVAQWDPEHELYQHAAVTTGLTSPGELLAAAAPLIASQPVTLCTCAGIYTMNQEIRISWAFTWLHLGTGSTKISLEGTSTAVRVLNQTSTDDIFIANLLFNSSPSTPPSGRPVSFAAAASISELSYALVLSASKTVGVFGCVFHEIVFGSIAVLDTPNTNVVDNVFLESTVLTVNGEKYSPGGGAVFVRGTYNLVFYRLLFPDFEEAYNSSIVCTNGTTAEALNGSCIMTESLDLFKRLLTENETSPIPSFFVGPFFEKDLIINLSGNNMSKVSHPIAGGGIMIVFQEKVKELQRNVTFSPTSFYIDLVSLLVSYAAVDLMDDDLLLDAAEIVFAFMNMLNYTMRTVSQASVNDNIVLNARTLPQADPGGGGGYGGAMAVEMILQEYSTPIIGYQVSTVFVEPIPVPSLSFNNNVFIKCSASKGGCLAALIFMFSAGLFISFDVNNNLFIDCTATLGGGGILFTETMMVQFPLYFAAFGRSAIPFPIYSELSSTISSGTVTIANNTFEQCVSGRNAPVGPEYVFEYSGGGVLLQYVFGQKQQNPSTPLILAQAPYAPTTLIEGNRIGDCSAAMMGGAVAIAGFSLFPNVGALGSGVFSFSENDYINCSSDFIGGAVGFISFTPGGDGMSVLFDHEIFDNCTALESGGAISTYFFEEAPTNYFLNLKSCFVRGGLAQEGAGGGLFIYFKKGGGANAKVYVEETVTDVLPHTLQFVACSAFVDGGGVSVIFRQPGGEKLIFIILKSYFTQCTSLIQGGGVSVFLTCGDSTPGSSTCQSDSLVYAAHTYIIDNTAFIDCTSKNLSGGAFSLLNPSGSLVDVYVISIYSFFQGCTGSIFGGGAIAIVRSANYFSDGGSPDTNISQSSLNGVFILYSEFMSCSASTGGVGGGGAVSIFNILSRVFVAATTFRDNLCSQGEGGSALYILSPYTSQTNVLITDATAFINNVMLVDPSIVAEAGGALALSGVSATISNTLFQQNSAVLGRASDVFITDDSSGISLMNCTFFAGLSDDLNDTVSVLTPSLQNLSINLDDNVFVCASGYSFFASFTEMLPRVIRAEVRSGCFDTTNILQCYAVTRGFSALCRPCPEGFFSLRQTSSLTNRSNAQCLECPEGVKCPGAATMTVLPGYWVGNLSSDAYALNTSLVHNRAQISGVTGGDLSQILVQTSNSERNGFSNLKEILGKTSDLDAEERLATLVSFCPHGYCCSSSSGCGVFFNGDYISSCSGNRTGTLCGTCQANFSFALFSNDCVPNYMCYEAGTFIVVGILIFAAYISYILFNPTAASTGSFKIITYFFSVINLVSINQEWENIAVNIAGSFVEALASFIGLDVTTDNGPLALCPYPNMSARLYLSLHYFLPLLLFAGLGVGFACLKLTAIGRRQCSSIARRHEKPTPTSSADTDRTPPLELCEPIDTEERRTSATEAALVRKNAQYDASMNSVDNRATLDVEDGRRDRGTIRSLFVKVVEAQRKKEEEREGMLLAGGSFSTRFAPAFYTIVALTYSTVLSTTLRLASCREIQTRDGVQSRLFYAGHIECWKEAWQIALVAIFLPILFFYPFGLLYWRHWKRGRRMSHVLSELKGTMSRLGRRLTTWLPGRRGGPSEGTFDSEGTEMASPTDHNNGSAVDNPTFTPEGRKRRPESIIDGKRSSSVSSVLYLLEAPFREGCLWWEFILLLRRLVLSVVYTIALSSTEAEFAFAVVQSCCCVLFLAMHSYFRPFRSSIDQAAESVSLFILCVISILQIRGVTLFTSGIGFENINALDSTSLAVDTAVFGCVMVMVAYTVLVILGAIVRLAAMLYRRCKSDKEHKRGLFRLRRRKGKEGIGRPGRQPRQSSHALSRDSLEKALD